MRYVVVGFALAGLFLLVYTLITPWREFALIRAGNSAAAIALVGALLGFCLPLANTIAHSASLTDVVLWALVALAVQVDRPCRHATDAAGPEGRRSKPTELSAGITAGGFAACFGLINAACLTT